MLANTPIKSIKEKQKQDTPNRKHQDRLRRPNCNTLEKKQQHNSSTAASPKGVLLSQPYFYANLRYLVRSEVSQWFLSINFFLGFFFLDLFYEAEEQYQEQMKEEDEEKKNKIKC
jgi:hypothetical protein